jgi:DNA-directed RNA polymerase subunit RPC12/RpoP
MASESCAECGRTLKDDEAAYLVHGRTRVVCGVCYGTLHPACPRCRARLERPRKGANACPQCGETVFVRPTQRVFGSTILSAVEAAELETVLAGGLRVLGDPERVYLERRAQIRARTGRDPTMAQVVRELRPEIERRQMLLDVLRHLRHLQVEIADFEAAEAALTKRLERRPNPGEVKYELWESLLARHAGSEELYLRLAADLYRDRRDPFPAKQSAARMKLAEMRRAQVRAVRVAVRPGCCGECRAQQGNTLSIDEALKLLPVPCHNCTHGLSDQRDHPWCRCTYAPVS